MLRELTKQYIEAFNNKDIQRVAQLLTDDFVLEDPVVKRVEKKSEVLKSIQNLFDSCIKLSFEAKNIYRDNQITIIEFILKLDETVIIGTDIIEWEDNKMKELRAYLDIAKG
jgi:limonene-1,2-epoxide hydrolase